MAFVDILIPLAAGLLFIFAPNLFVKPSSEKYESKKKLFKKLGFALLGVSVLYFIIKLFQN
jgi:hypothetical protein